jgi:hypothetical protein
VRDLMNPVTRRTCVAVKWSLHKKSRSDLASVKNSKSAAYRAVKMRALTSGARASNCLNSE